MMQPIAAASALAPSMLAKLLPITELVEIPQEYLAVFVSVLSHRVRQFVVSLHILQFDGLCMGKLCPYHILQIVLGSGVGPLHAAQQRMTLPGGHTVVLVVVRADRLGVEAQLPRPVAPLDLGVDRPVRLLELLQVHPPHQLPAGQAVDGKHLGILHVGIVQADLPCFIVHGGSGLALVRPCRGRPLGSAFASSCPSAPGGQAGG